MGIDRWSGVGVGIEGGVGWEGIEWKSRVGGGSRDRQEEWGVRGREWG